MPNRMKEPHATKKLRKLESGHFKARVTFWDPETGKRRETTATFATEREAKKWKTEQEMRFRQNPNPKPPSNEHFGLFLQRWLSDVARLQVRETTWNAYRYAAAHAIRHLGPKPLRNLTALDFQGLYTQLSLQNLRPSTIRIVHNVCRQALDAAVDYQLLAANPIYRAKPPRIPRPVVQPPTQAQAQAFLRAADHHPWKALWYVIALTGCRRGEALGLQWHDINWDAHTITIQRTLAGKAAHRQTHEPKTQHGRRVVAASQFLMQVLKEQRRQQNLMRMASGPNWDKASTWVFTTRKGKSLDGDNVRRTFKKVLAEAGLPATIRIHDLRHAMATAWLAQGIPVKVVSERLGHASIAITLQIYAHVLPHMQAEAAELMDNWLVSPTPES